MKNKIGLLIVDVQNDFCPGGALAVPGADETIPALNKYIKEFSKKGLPIFFSRDWHPEKTSHFKAYGGKWPNHCIQQTEGARFHKDLKLPKESIIISKGMEPDSDSYSAFHAVNSQGIPFLQLLKNLEIREVFVGGLATDYCVKSSVLDALRFGFKAYLLIDAVKGVDVKPGDSQKAVEEMLKAGAVKIDLAEFQRSYL